MTVDLTSPCRGNVSTASRGADDLGILDNLDELTIVSPSRPSPQRPARRPRTPLARNTIGSRYTMSPPRPNTAVASRYFVSPTGDHPGLYGVSPRPNSGVESGRDDVWEALTSHFSSTATPPRSHNPLDMTIDLTDSPLPLATPGSPEEISPAGTSGSSGIRCPVCLDGVPQITSSRRTMMSTVCGHIFCSTCLPACIRANGRCPTCRKILRQNDMHPIFL